MLENATDQIQLSGVKDELKRANQISQEDQYDEKKEIQSQIVSNHQDSPQHAHMYMG